MSKNEQILSSEIGECCVGLGMELTVGLVGPCSEVLLISLATISRSLEGRIWAEKTANFASGLAFSMCFLGLLLKKGISAWLVMIKNKYMFDQYHKSYKSSGQQSTCLPPMPSKGSRGAKEEQRAIGVCRGCVGSDLAMEQLRIQYGQSNLMGGISIGVAGFSGKKAANLIPFRVTTQNGMLGVSVSSSGQQLNWLAQCVIMRITSFPERLKIIGLDPLVSHHQVIAHQLHQVRLALAHLQMRLLFLLQVPQAHLLAAHQRKLALVHLQQPVLRHLLALVLLHQQLEVLVVHEESALLLHQQVIPEGVDVANRHLQLVDLLQPVLGACVDLVDCEFLLAEGEELVAAAELDLDDIASQLVVSDLLGAEVEEGDLRLALSHLPEEVVHLLALRQFEGEDAVEGVQLDGVELRSPDDFPLFDLFLLVLGKRPPPEDVLLQLVLAIFVEDEQNAVIRGHYRRVHVNLVLQFEHSLLCDLLVLREVVDLHLVVFLHRELIFHFLADGGLEHEAGLRVAHLDDFLDDFVGEAVDDDLKFVLPHQDPSFLEVDADQAPAISHVQILNGVILGVSVEDGHGVGLELPLLDALAGNAEVITGFCILADNFFELFLFVGESTEFLSSLLRAEHYLRPCDLRVRFVVDIDDVVQFLDPVVPLFQFSGGIDFEHLVGAPPIEVDLGRMVDGLNDGQFQQLIIALLILRQMHLHWLKFLLEFAIGVDAPTVNQLIFAVLVRSEDSGIPVAGFNFLDHRWDLHIIDDFPFLQRD